MKLTVSFVALLAAAPAIAEKTRQLDAHEHGVGTLNVAIEGATIAMEFEAPGADIVGFEYGAKTDADLAAIETALSTLSAPSKLFVMPDAAACSVTDAKAELESEDAHEEHDEDGHEDHKDEHHKDEGHQDDNHDDHVEETGHTEFHAEYTFTCGNPEALSQITFAYFEAFPNAQEVEVQIIDATGARAFEVERDAPVLELDG
jgi:hypothetical protein